LMERVRVYETEQSELDPSCDGGEHRDGGRGAQCNGSTQSARPAYPGCEQESHDFVYLDGPGSNEFGHDSSAVKEGFTAKARRREEGWERVFGLLDLCVP